MDDIHEQKTTLEKPPAAAEAAGTAGFLRPPEQPGELGRLAHYRVLKVLGRGGMGMVFEAEDIDLKRPVGLKVIRPDIGADHEVRSRFLREARAAAALKSDHVVTIYQVGEDAGVMFLAMERLRGSSLAAWLKPDRRATVAETLILGRQIARGLAAAHAAGLVHRDIKPENLWLEAPRARLKILDFGLARLADGESARLTSPGAILGTPSYIPPEMLRNEDVDHRGDLFSFGCVLYRMTTGRLPFGGETLHSVLQAVATHTPPPPLELNPNIPPQLDDLIRRMLAKQPADRPPSAQAVFDELVKIEREWKQQTPTTVNRAETIVDAAVAGEKTVRQRPLARRLALGAAILGTIVIGWLAWGAFGTQTGDAGAGTEPSAPSAHETAAATAPQLPQKVDLLALFQIPRDRVDGRWELADGKLRGEVPGKDPGLCRIAVPWDPPDEYRLRINVKRTRPAAGHCSIGLSSGSHRFTILIDHPLAQRGISGSGVNLIDNKPIEKRKVASRERILVPGKMVTIVCTVRRNSVSATADGREFFQWEGDLSRLNRQAGGVTTKLFLGGSHNAAFEFDQVVLEPLGEDPGRAI